MDAMSYEFLIRRAYHCGRHGAKGKADTRDYHELERAVRQCNSPETSTKSKEELEYDVRVAGTKVALGVEDAIKKAMAEVKYDADAKEEIKILEELIKKVSLQRDIKVINEVIEEAMNIFIKLKLEAI